MIRTASPERPRSIDELLSPQLVAAVSRLDFASRTVLAGKLKGERRSKRRGQSVEFADYRAYVRGDDIRRIDWNLYARLDRLFLKLFLEEEDMALHLVLDCSASHDCGEPGKFLFMQRLAMTLGYIGLVNFNRVSVSAIGGGPAGAGGAEGAEGVRQAPVVTVMRDLRGRRRTRDLAAFLCGLEPSGRASFTQACTRIAASRRGRGVMVVISDFLVKEGYEAGLRVLIGHGYDVAAIQVLSPQELDPGLPPERGGLAGDLRLKDIEDAERAEITVSAPLLKRYRATVGAYVERLRVFCAQRGATHALASSGSSIETLVLEQLRTRGIVR